MNLPDTSPTLREKLTDAFYAAIIGIAAMVVYYLVIVIAKSYYL